MNNFLSINIFLLLGLFFLGACSTETTDSENIRTAGVWARMVVDGREDGTARVVVELNSGGSNGTNIILSAGDTLEATAYNRTQVMQQDSDFLDIDYQTTFNSNTENEFVVQMLRPNDIDALNSRVTLPQSFTISTPQTGQSYSTTDSILIVWSNNVGNGDIDLSYSVICETNLGDLISAGQSPVVTDNGEYLIDPASISLYTDAGINRAKPCELTVSLNRRATGTLDSNFSSGGSIRASQYRNVSDVIINF